MKNNIFIFETNDPIKRSVIESTLFNTVTNLAKDQRKNFQVKISPIEKNKTPKQLRGIHRLISVISKQLREWGNLEYTEEVVKEYIKRKTGFMTRLTTIKNKTERSIVDEIITKSFKHATLQELKDIISFTEAWGKGELGIEDCYLESQELKDMEGYFKK